MPGDAGKVEGLEVNFDRLLVGEETGDFEGDGDHGLEAWIEIQVWHIKFAEADYGTQSGFIRLFVSA